MFASDNFYSLTGKGGGGVERGVHISSERYHVSEYKNVFGLPKSIYLSKLEIRMLQTKYKISSIFFSTWNELLICKRRTGIQNKQCDISMKSY